MWDKLVTTEKGGVWHVSCSKRVHGGVCGWLPFLVEIQSFTLYCIDPRGAPFPNIACCSLTAPSHRRAHRWHWRLLLTTGASGCCPPLAPSAVAHHWRQRLLPTTGTSSCCPLQVPVAAAHQAAAAAAHHWRQWLLPTSGASSSCLPQAPAHCCRSRSCHIAVIVFIEIFK